MAPWSLEAYCKAQEPLNLDTVAPSTRLFLESLTENVSTLHPFCFQNAPPFQLDDVPPMGPLEHRFEDQTYPQAAFTIWRIIAPPLLAMGELWLRLFAGLLGPLGILYLVKLQLQPPCSVNLRFVSVAATLSVASSLVLMTDTLYVLEYGPVYGATLLVLSIFLALKTALQYNLIKVGVILAALVLVASHLVWDYSTDSLTFGDVADHVTIPEGLYFDASNDYISSIVEQWPETYRTYTHQTGATRWMPTGDSRTGLPFLLNQVSMPHWNRMFLSVDDGEVLALDMAFPTMGHDPKEPLYMVLHGLNGGSQEEYVRDFTERRVQEGSTVVVMVARGLMDLPIRGWDMFHGARTSDAHQAALALRKGLGRSQILVGVGYSMGAIILSNYVPSYGIECALDAAIAISGGLDMRQQEHFVRAQRLWQPMLAEDLREVFLIGKWGERVRARLPKDVMLNTMRASHITEIDENAVVHYNNFDDLDHYYRSMSALGDIPRTSTGLVDNPDGKIHNVAIPFCVMHALDDPLITWRTVASNKGFMHPYNLSKSGSGNLMILLTKGGGHVGWPLGWWPSLNKWRFMSDAASTFSQAVHQAKLALPQEEPVEEVEAVAAADIVAEEQESMENEGSMYEETETE